MEANLGLATTRQLLEELRARGEVTAFPRMHGHWMARTARNMLASLPEKILDYRTVDE